jgi:hypothetical protein
MFSRLPASDQYNLLRRMGEEDAKTYFPKASAAVNRRINKDRERQGLRQQQSAPTPSTGRPDFSSQAVQPSPGRGPPWDLFKR